MLDNGATESSSDGCKLPKWKMAARAVRNRVEIVKTAACPNEDRLIPRVVRG